MKRIFLCFCLAVIARNINAQVGIGTASPDASAQLEINSNNKGLLIPRVAQANLLSAPATGLLVYQTNDPAGFYYFDGANWQLLAAVNNMWGLNGNAATTSSNFVGTTDAQPLRFKVNNQQAGLIDMDALNGVTFLG